MFVGKLCKSSEILKQLVIFAARAEKHHSLEFSKNESQILLVFGKTNKRHSYFALVLLVQNTR